MRGGVEVVETGPLLGSQVEGAVEVHGEAVRFSAFYRVIEGKFAYACWMRHYYTSHGVGMLML